MNKVVTNFEDFMKCYPREPISEFKIQELREKVSPALCNFREEDIKNKDQFEAEWMEEAERIINSVKAARGRNNEEILAVTRMSKIAEFYTKERLSDIIQDARPFIQQLENNNGYWKYHDLMTVDGEYLIDVKTTANSKLNRFKMRSSVYTSSRNYSNLIFGYIVRADKSYTLDDIFSVHIPRVINNIEGSD